LQSFPFCFMESQTTPCTYFGFLFSFFLFFLFFIISFFVTHCRCAKKGITHITGFNPFQRILSLSLSVSAFLLILINNASSSSSNFYTFILSFSIFFFLISSKLIYSLTHILYKRVSCVLLRCFRRCRNPVTYNHFFYFLFPL